jgi:hypothetical protein
MCADPALLSGEQLSGQVARPEYRRGGDRARNDEAYLSCSQEQGSGSVDFIPDWVHNCNNTDQLSQIVPEQPR